jgi:DNA-binding winged helix-turn-helix (wHTH) protein/tetratricopeptide (TPR) repeat protein
MKPGVDFAHVPSIAYDGMRIVHAAAAPRRDINVAAAIPRLYRFGDFTLDASCRELRRGEAPVELSSKPFSCVLHLIENRHRVVDREELMRAVWGHVHLTESVLGQAIRQARQVLGDSGEDQQVIKTVRGFGYRWAAPVAIGLDASDALPATAKTRPRMAIALGAIALIALAAWIARPHVPRETPIAETPAPGAAAKNDAIALLLPVVGSSAPDDAWIRLGLMEYIANRLRADGQPMVPTDSVILLLHGINGVPDANALTALTASTDARIVLEAEVGRDGDDWRVTLHSSSDTRPSVSATGRGGDILAAAQRAADDVAIALGRVPVPATDAAPDLSLLVQRINAAMLTQNRTLARRLIDDAPAALRTTPEIRFQLARIDFYEHDGAKAEAEFSALLAETPADREPVLRARILNGLAVAHVVRGDRAAAEPLMEEAARLIDRQDAKALRDTQGTIWMNLGNIAQERGDLDLAGERMARARRMFEATGDVRNLAQLELNVGVLETRRDRFAEGVRHFENAARLHAAIHNDTDELKSLCFIVQANLRLLDAPTAEPHAARIAELLQSATNPEIIGIAKLTLSDLHHAAGREQASDRLLDEVLASVPVDGAIDLQAADALAERAERAASRHDWPAAKHAASGLVSRIEPDCASPSAPDVDRASLVLVRAELARGALEAAHEASARLPACSSHVDDLAAMERALADAELAAAAGDGVGASAGFERALALADRSRTPARMRDAAERYVDWLLAIGDDARLLRVSERIAGFADRDYEAALVQLRVYRKLGPPAAWQTALARARRLAGERRIPPELVPAS